jgi:hypothetical protein
VCVCVVGLDIKPCSRRALRILLGLSAVAPADLCSGYTGLDLSQFGLGVLALWTIWPTQQTIWSRVPKPPDFQFCSVSMHYLLQKC